MGLDGSLGGVMSDKNERVEVEIGARVLEMVAFVVLAVLREFVVL